MCFTVLYTSLALTIWHQNLNESHIKADIYTHTHMRGADKSLARPGREKATATKLGIYSTYSSRSSIHFLARCSNFCKPLKKKKLRKLSEQGVRGSNDLSVGRKMANFQFFFSIQGADGSPTWPDPENRRGDQDTGNPGFFWVASAR